MRTPVYLDNHASTAPDPSVLEVMLRVARDHYGNPASAGHAYGWAAAKVVEDAREQVAALVGVSAREIVFTGGATEAANLAVLGLAAAVDAPGHAVATVLEHASVRAPLDWLVSRGWRLTVVGVDATGVVDPEAVAGAVGADTRLVCCMAAQNEVGTLQPVAAIGARCRELGVPLFCDAAQAPGRVPVTAARDGAALLALSAHKMYGPKGVGALYVRRRDPRVTLAPLCHGGGQERGLRPGTPDVAGIAGFGEACRLAALRQEDDARHLRALAERFLARVEGSLSGVVLYGDRDRRLPGSLSLGFRGIHGAALLPALPQLALSSGAACSSGSGQSSAVLAALGVPADLAAASLRLCFARTSTTDEADFAADAIIAAIPGLRDLVT